MATEDENQQDGIVLDDGTWVDVGPDGRWRPTAAERARALVVIGVALGALVLLALVLSVGGDGDDPSDVAAASSTTEPDASSSTTEDLPDPASIDGEPPSAQCVSDDRGAAPLRDRAESVVLVLNATSRSGHAGDVTALLEGMGYEAVVPDNGGRREVTSVAYLAGYCAEAERVVVDLALPEATVEPVDRELLPRIGRARIVVSLGADSL